MSADEKTRLQPGPVQTGVGTQLSGIYELDERLGSGGMGEVYRGHNIQTGDLVAIKIVLPEFAKDQTILSLFRKEASILNHLSHEAVVRYHVFTIDPGIARPYLAMEYVDGDSLFEVMRRGPMSIEDVRKLCHRLASGLNAVHQAGAIHRDLSPDNIILPGGSVERAKIIDFGIARSAKVGGETLIGGRFAGKYNYVSPEQLGLYGGDVTERSDIYSLGLVLAAALRGKPIDMSGSQFEVVEKRRTVPDLSEIGGELRPVLEAMLQPDPRDRPSGMDEIAWMTRSGSQVERDEGYFRPTRPPTAQPSALSQWDSAETSGPTESAVPDAGTEPGFVEHVRPAHLSKPRPAPKPSASATIPESRPRKTAARRNIAIAALAALVAATGTTAYLGGFLPPWSEPSGPVPTETSEPTLRPSEPPPEKIVEIEGREQPATQPQADSGPATPVVPDRLPDDIAGEGKTELAEGVSEPQDSGAEVSEEIIQETGEPTTGVKSADQILDSLIKQSEILKNDGAATVDRPDDVPEVTPSEARPSETIPVKSEPSLQPDLAEESEPSAPAPDSKARTTPSQASNEDGDLRPPPFEDEPPAAEDVATTSDNSPTPQPPILVPLPKDDKAEEPQGEAITMKIPRPEVSKPEVPKPEVPKPPVLKPELPEPQLPKTELPNPSEIAAERVAWVRDFRGGDCFFAAPMLPTGDPIRVEGFATTTDSFVEMEERFINRFGVEPELEVRIIDAAQCEVPRFMRDLPATSAQRPDLRLHQMSIPSGGALSGTLRIPGGMRTSLLLIDHAGMVFNLDAALAVNGEEATFSVPITLDAGENVAGKPLPELLIAIAGPTDLRAAELDEPAPASVLLPRILSEIREAGNGFSVTTKYFQIGG